MRLHHDPLIARVLDESREPVVIEVVDEVDVMTRGDQPVRKLGLGMSARSATPCQRDFA